MLPSTDLKASAPRTIAFSVLNSPAHPYRCRRFACPLAGANARLAEKRGLVTPSFRGTCTPNLLPVRLALAALERRIGRLCGAVRGSRPDDPAELRRSLTGLIAALDELAGAVTPKIEATSSAGTAEARAHALGAYSNAGD